MKTMNYVVLGMALTALCCKGLSASQPSSNGVANFIKNKYCSPKPVIVLATAPDSVDAVVAKAPAAQSDVNLNKEALASTALKSSKEIKSEVKLSAMNNIGLAAARKAREAVQAIKAPSVDKTEVKEAPVAAKITAPVASVTAPAVALQTPVTPVQVSKVVEERSQEHAAKKSVKNREAEMRAAEQKRKAAYLARKESKKESGE